MQIVKCFNPLKKNHNSCSFKTLGAATEWSSIKLQAGRDLFNQLLYMMRTSSLLQINFAALHIQSTILSCSHSSQCNPIQDFLCLFHFLFLPRVSFFILSNNDCKRMRENEILTYDFTLWGGGFSTTANVLIYFVVVNALSQYTRH